MYKKEESKALAQSLVFGKYSCMTTETVTMKRKLCDGVETVKCFYYLDDTLNAAGGSEPAVTTRTRISR